MLHTMPKKLCVALISALALTASVAKADPIVANGSFENYSGGYDYTGNGGTPNGPDQVATTPTASWTTLTNWTVSGKDSNGNATSGNSGQNVALLAPSGQPGNPKGSGFYNPLAVGSYNFDVSNSSNGGNFLGIGTGYIGSISQSISGFTPGQSYYVNFEQATGKIINNDVTTSKWQVDLGSETKYSDNMTFPKVTPTSHFQGWSSQQLLFTPSSATETLRFTALNASNGAFPFTLLDGVSITPAYAAPLPSSLSLSVVGLIVLAGYNMVRRTNKSGPVDFVSAL